MFKLAPCNKSYVDGIYKRDGNSHCTIRKVQTAFIIHGTYCTINMLQPTHQDTLHGDLN